MAIKFNPLTGNFDFTGSGGGGGSSYIDGEVQNFSALPTSTPPDIDAAYLVREAEGTWLLNRKPAGIYIRTDDTGVRADDWTYAGEFPDVFNDANLVVYANADSTKNVKFDVSAVTTGTTRTITVPDANVTLPNQGTSTTDNVTFNEVTTDNNLNVGGDLIISNAITVGTNGVIFENAPSENTSLTTLATASRFVSLPDASGTLALTSDFAAPPAIGNTTPAAGTFTTLAASNSSGTILRATDSTSSSNFNNIFEAVRGSTTVFSVRDDGIANSVLGIGAGTDCSLSNGIGVVIAASRLLAWTDGSTNSTNRDTSLRRDAAGVLAQSNGATAQTFRIYTTIGGTGNVDFERLFLKGQTGGAFQIGTEKGGTGSARALEFQTDGVTRMTLGSAGEIGFFGTAAAAQPAAIADATDAATTQARLNDLLAAMRTLGLIDT
jgi:hypothetical protein